jgi:hypothetical protein
MTVNHFELPDYDLAETITFGPRNFYRSDLKPQEKETREIILVLSLMFNDMKDLVYLHYQLNKGACVSKVVSRYRGQWTGMQEHAFRILMSTFREVLETFQKNSSVFNSVEFVRSLNMLSPENKSRWHELQALAHQRDAELKGFLKLLVQIRGNFCFHYSDGSFLAQGFETFFDKEQTRAYMSLADTVKSTRFYFADAAYQGKLKALIPDLPKFQKQFLSYLEDVMTTLRFLIEYFFKKNNILTKDERAPYHED